jgi:hypothetical protein
MNKKMVVLALATTLATPLYARDMHDLEYQRQLTDTSLQQANRDRVEATRRIGQDLPRTQQIYPLQGHSPAYIHQDHSGTYLLNSHGQPVGIIGR